jgi:predicted amidohydrolase
VKPPHCLPILFLLLLAVSGRSVARAQENPTIRIAIGQIVCLDGDRSGNLVRMEHAMQKAVQEKADLITFPETALLGWVNPDAWERACAIPGENTDELGRLARKYHLWICTGLAEKVEDSLYDSAVLIDDKGNIRLKHRKINVLEELMASPYTPGCEVQVADTKWGRFGMIICADSWGEGVAERMKALTPDLLLVPYGWAASEDQWPEHGKELEKWVRYLGKFLECPVVGTDPVGEISHGPWTGLTYGGQSLAVDSKGKVLVTCADRDTDLKIIELTIQSKK